jgi:hypothetical protein
LDVRGQIRAGNYQAGPANINAFSLEIGGAANNQNSGEGIIYFHHFSTMAHQLRYRAGNFYLEATANGYGTNNSPNLYIGGQLGAREVRVTTATWPDYVFRPTYRLRPLSEVESYIIEKGHLPDVPSETDALKDGIDVAKTNVMLLQKIEELTLYMIELNKKVEELQEKKSALEKGNRGLPKQAQTEGGCENK